MLQRSERATTTTASAGFLCLIPQNLGRDEKEIKDCQTFADMTQTIADTSANNVEFLDNMAKTFTAADNSSISEMTRTQNMHAQVTFHDTGFKPQFQDGSNQVRHFVAGFIAGAKDPFGGYYARSVMNERENPNDPSDRPDINLNGVSTMFGATYGGPDINFARQYLARAIRKAVCQ